MTAQIDFLPVATANGASTMTQANYIASSMLTTGVGVGVADPTLANKCWRQSSIIAAVIAQYIATKTGANVIDDGTTATILSNLSQALSLSTYAPDTSGTVNVLTATLTPAPPALVDGFIIALKPANTNNSSATFNLNGLGAYAIQNAGGALSGGELVAGKVYELAWLAASNIWFLMGAATTAVTQVPTDNSTKIATTAFVKSVGFAPLASPVFTGTPQGPTPGAGDNSVNLATTAFVNTALFGTTGLLPSGTRTFFAQAVAPNGWVQDTSTYANNRMIRVVSTVAGTTGSGGTGGNGYGGSMDPTVCNVVPVHTHSFTTSTENATHTHTFTTGTESATHTHSDSGHQHTYGYKGGTQPQSGSSTQCWWSDTTQNTGVGYANLGTESATHYHTGTTATEGANHAHTGTTDNGSSSTNYTPNYLSVILCTKS